MNQLSRSMTSFLWGILSAVTFTLFLYIALPLLTHIPPNPSGKTGNKQVLINIRKPPPPPSEDRDRPKSQEPVEKKQIRKQAKQVQRSRPKFETPRVSLAMGASNVSGIKIGTVSDFKVSDSLFMSAFSLGEVDQPPRVLRVFPPVYPFDAKRDNIQGRVMLRFVVDLDGLAKEAEVVEAEPEGVFEDAALKAVEKYKFRPAVKNGKIVTCIARLPILFQLD